MESSPVQQAHAFAAAADDFEERGMLQKAVDAHFRAAEQCLLAASVTSDMNANTTLRLMYANHTKRGKDLQRKIASSSTAAAKSTQHQSSSALEKNSSYPTQISIDNNRVSSSSIPSTISDCAHVLNQTVVPVNTQQQYKPAYQQQQASTSSNTFTQKQYNSHPTSDWQESDDSSGYGSRHFFLGQPPTESALFSNNSAPEGLNPSTSYNNEFSRVAVMGVPKEGKVTFKVESEDSHSPATVAVQSLDTSDQDIRNNNTPQPKLFDSMDQSYLLLNEKSESLESDEEGPKDPFNKFWDTVESLVQKISIAAPSSFPSNSTPATTAIPVTRTNQPVFTTTNRSNYNPSSHISSPGASEPSASSFPPHPYSRPMSNFPMARGSGPQRQMGNTNRPEVYRGGNTMESSQKQSAVGSSTQNAMLQSYFVVDGVSESMMLPPPSGGGGGIITNHGGDSILILGGNQGANSHFQTRPTKNSRIKTIEEYQIENQQLKQTMDFLARRVAVLEKVVEENNLLKSSIINLRQDFQKQAKKYATTSNHTFSPPSSGYQTNPLVSPTVLNSTLNVNNTTINPSSSHNYDNLLDKISSLETEILSYRKQIQLLEKNQQVKTEVLGKNFITEINVKKSDVFVNTSVDNNNQQNANLNDTEIRASFSKLVEKEILPHAINTNPEDKCIQKDVPQHQHAQIQLQSSIVTNLNNSMFFSTTSAAQERN